MTTVAIDQAMRSTGLCVLPDDPHAEPITRVIDNSALDGFAAMDHIVRDIETLVTDHRPNLVVLEDYAYGTGTNNITRIAEVVGAVKHMLGRRGYTLGYGTARNKAEREQARYETLHSERLVVLQTGSNMKKFMLGDGGASKDTAYQLKVLDATGMRFNTDDECDAYMHAWMARIVLSVLRGVLSLEDLPPNQQAAIISAHSLDGKLSKSKVDKALKMPIRDRQRLIGVIA